MFQGRFTSCPLDHEHGLAASRYVFLNPVRARLVESATDWLWSSAACHAGLKKSDPLVEKNDLQGHCPGVRGWRQLLSSEEEEKSYLLRQSTRTGRPCGNEDFEMKAERLTQRKLPRRETNEKPREIGIVFLVSPQQGDQ